MLSTDVVFYSLNTCHDILALDAIITPLLFFLSSQTLAPCLWMFKVLKSDCQPVSHCGMYDMFALQFISTWSLHLTPVHARSSFPSITASSSASCDAGDQDTLHDDQQWADNVFTPLYFCLVMTQSDTEIMQVRFKSLGRIKTDVSSNIRARIVTLRPVLKRFTLKKHRKSFDLNVCWVWVF